MTQTPVENKTCMFCFRKYTKRSLRLTEEEMVVCRNCWMENSSENKSDVAPAWSQLKAIPDSNELSDDKLPSSSASKEGDFDVRSGDLIWKSRKRRLRRTKAAKRFSVPTSLGNIDFEVAHEDLKFLGPEEFLNDTVIDFYLQYIQRPEVFDSMTKGRFLIYNSFFYKKLSVVFGNARSEEVDDSTLNVLWRWAREDIFEKSYICIPVHDRLHWSLVVACFPKAAFSLESESDSCLLHFDSLTTGGHSSQKIFKTLRNYLIATWKSKNNQLSCGEPQKLPPSLLPGRRVKVPQQDNEYDCGCFLLYYLKEFVQCAPNTLNLQDIDRRRLFGREWFSAEKPATLREEIKDLMEQHITSRVLKQKEKITDNDSDVELVTTRSVMGDDILSDSAPSRSKLKGGGSRQSFRTVNVELSAESNENKVSTNEQAAEATARSIDCEAPTFQGQVDNSDCLDAGERINTYAEAPALLNVEAEEHDIEWKDLGPLPIDLGKLGFLEIGAEFTRFSDSEQDIGEKVVVETKENNQQVENLLAVNEMLSEVLEGGLDGELILNEHKNNHVEKLSTQFVEGDGSQWWESGGEGLVEAMTLEDNELPTVNPLNTVPDAVLLADNLSIEPQKELVANDSCLDFLGLENADFGIECEDLNEWVGLGESPKTTEKVVSEPIHELEVYESINVNDIIQPSEGQSYGDLGNNVLEMELLPNEPLVKLDLPRKVSQPSFPKISKYKSTNLSLKKEALSSLGSRPSRRSSRLIKMVKANKIKSSITERRNSQTPRRRHLSRRSILVDVESNNFQSLGKKRSRRKAKSEGLKDGLPDTSENMAEILSENGLAVASSKSQVKGNFFPLASIGKDLTHFKENIYVGERLEYSEDSDDRERLSNYEELMERRKEDPWMLHSPESARTRGIRAWDGFSKLLLSGHPDNDSVTRESEKLLCSETMSSRSFGPQFLEGWGGKVPKMSNSTELELSSGVAFSAFIQKQGDDIDGNGVRKLKYSTEGEISVRQHNNSEVQNSHDSAYSMDDPSLAKVIFSEVEPVTDKMWSATAGLLDLKAEKMEDSYVVPTSEVLLVRSKSPQLSQVDQATPQSKLAVENMGLEKNKQPEFYKIIRTYQRGSMKQVAVEAQDNGNGEKEVQGIDEEAVSRTVVEKSPKIEKKGMVVMKSQENWKVENSGGLRTSRRERRRPQWLDDEEIEVWWSDSAFPKSTRRGNGRTNDEKKGNSMAGRQRSSRVEESSEPVALEDF